MQLTQRSGKNPSPKLSEQENGHAVIFSPPRSGRLEADPRVAVAGAVS